MKIAIDYTQSLEKNAERYFQKAKKAKKKKKGAERALTVIRKKRDKAEEVEVEEKELNKRKKRQWYEKFHWCYSSDGFLMIGGRDATTNEIVVKKHTQPGDKVFHTDMAGSPFVIIKAEGKDIPQTTIREAAEFTLAYSKAWKKGLMTTPVFCVNPDQVTKEANTGEYVPKGAFMIYGDTEYIDNEMNFAIGVYEDGSIMGGPVKAVTKHCDDYLEIRPGREKTSDVAKTFKHKYGGNLDEIIRTLPAGGCKIHNA